MVSCRLCRQIVLDSWLALGADASHAALARRAHLGHGAVLGGQAQEPRRYNCFTLSICILQLRLLSRNLRMLRW